MPATKPARAKVTARSKKVKKAAVQPVAKVSAKTTPVAPKTRPRISAGGRAMLAFLEGIEEDIANGDYVPFHDQ
jgi:hypothetical protein